MRTKCLQTAGMTRYSGKEWYYRADPATPRIAARAGGIP
jgi:hypothetical protein